MIELAGERACSSVEGWMRLEQRPKYNGFDTDKEPPGVRVGDQQGRISQYSSLVLYP